MKEVSFSDWLIQAFELANKKPVIWLGSVFVMALAFAIGHVSLALNIVFSVTSLFIGVGIVAHIDQGKESLLKTINKQLPFAMLLGIILMSVWFVFRVFANIYSAEEDKILLFFYHNEFAIENLQDKSFRQMMAWLYSSSIVCLIFTFLMVYSFASWFSYPLVLFKAYHWKKAREQGDKAFLEHSKAMYRLMTFVFLSALIGMSFVPLLTPLFYMLVSTLMYVSYHDIFEKIVKESLVKS